MPHRVGVIPMSELVAPGGRLFLIADTHLHHARPVLDGERPAGFEEIVYERWRAAVGDRDTVVHLGDVIFKRAGELGAILAALPGRKLLVRGNHDLNRAAWFVRKGFEAVYDELYVDDLLFTHEPMAPLPPHVRLNVHGHFHRVGTAHYELRRAPHELHYSEHPERYHLVEIDTGLAPIAMEDIWCMRLGFEPTGT